jgi:hypothetical protein
VQLIANEWPPPFQSFVEAGDRLATRQAYRSDPGCNGSTIDDQFPHPIPSAHLNPDRPELSQFVVTTAHG